MAQCTTQQGAYRCPKEQDHKGDCEVEDKSGARFGPYRDMLRARAYLRGCLDLGNDGQLDHLGLMLGVDRRKSGDELDVEPDAEYRERIWKEGKL